MILIIASHLFCINAVVLSQENRPSGNAVTIPAGATMDEVIRKAANVIPSPRQYEWQKLEFIAFIHFGMNTFMDREWGEGDEDISRFNPTALDAKQWVSVCKDAGMRLIILTAKHHDGFCLWPSQYTEHCVKNTSWRNGKGDVVRELSEACRGAGLKFGVYLSPWDRHEQSYGTPAYNEFFRNQLSELLTSYGEISEVWFDGANGEGSNGKKQVYDWQSYYQLIRRLQPNAVIAIMGPDVRWVGTESGYGRQTEWSVLPGPQMEVDRIAANSQQNPVDGAFVPRNLTNEDLGSRDNIKNAASLLWYPAETDVSIRRGWFYHPHDNDQVKTPDQLVDVYYNSVGLNSVLLLNLPPDRRGLIHDNDIQSLRGMRHILNETFEENLVEGATASASNERKGNEASLIMDEIEPTYWTTNEGVDTASIEFLLAKKQTFDRALLQENILVGQRIETFHLEWWDGTQWRRLAEGTTVGYKRLLKFPAVATSRLKLVIEQSRTNPTLSAFGLFKAPPQISFEPEAGAFVDSLRVSILSDTENTSIYYTLDDALPNVTSNRFTQSVVLSETATLKAIAVTDNGKKSIPSSAHYIKARHGIVLKSKYNPRYAAGGILALIDGLQGSSDFRDGRWQGYEGVDLEAVIDLKEVKKVQKISARFLQDINSWIFMPRSVEYLVSRDGEHFTFVGRVDRHTPEKAEGAIVESFDVELQNTPARYLRIVAKNLGTCPDWHKGAGGKAWIFSDAIDVKTL